MSNHEGFIVADGEMLAVEKLRRLAAGKQVLVLDGAYASALKAGLQVDYLLGDFDTISAPMLKHAKDNGVKIIAAADQNFTDLDKGIQFLDKLGMTAITIAQATGLRLDHTLHNVRLLTRCYKPTRSLIVHTQSEVVFLLQDERSTYCAKAGDGFAVLGAPRCEVTSHGLLYEMCDLQLDYAGQDSACNQLTQDQVQLCVKGSALIIHFVAEKRLKD